MRTLIGIDPGQAGGIAILQEGELLKRQYFLKTFKMPETPKDIHSLLKEYSSNSVCYLEKVHSMPGQGVASSFKFGRGYGNIEMALLSLGIPTVSVDPTKWMKSLALGTRGDRSKTEWKNHLKKIAQQLFPEHSFTLSTCDAALIVEYARRTENQQM